MKYHCVWCDYIYDEKNGDEDLWIPDKTLFSQLPNDFFCPFCDTHKDDFVILDEAIHYPMNKDYLTGLEAEHYPFYEIVDDVLTYQIQETQHPNDKEHFIYKIALIDESWDEIASQEFAVWEPYTWSFDIDYLDSFELRIFCFKDGVYSTGIITRDE